MRWGAARTLQTMEGLPMNRIEVDGCQLPTSGPEGHRRRKRSAEIRWARKVVGDNLNVRTFADVNAVKRSESPSDKGTPTKTKESRRCWAVCPGERGGAGRSVAVVCRQVHMPQPWRSTEVMGRRCGATERGTSTRYPPRPVRWTLSTTETSESDRRARRCVASATPKEQISVGARRWAIS